MNLPKNLRLQSFKFYQISKTELWQEYVRLIPVDLLATVTWYLRSWQFCLEIYEPSMYFDKNLLQKKFVKSPERSVVKICQANSW